jgi:hypothetical protein
MNYVSFANNKSNTLQIDVELYVMGVCIFDTFLNDLSILMVSPIDKEVSKTIDFINK